VLQWHLNLVLPNAFSELSGVFHIPIAWETISLLSQTRSPSSPILGTYLTGSLLGNLILTQPPQMKAL